MALDMLPEAAWTDVFGHPSPRIRKTIGFCICCMELKYSLGVCQEGLQKNEAGRKKLRYDYTMFFKTVRTGGSLENN